ncbi:MAG: pentapeptide repeat-containing protein [Acidimicrobiales bacterium]
MSAPPPDRAPLAPRLPADLRPLGPHDGGHDGDELVWEAVSVIGTPPVTAGIPPGVALEVTGCRLAGVRIPGADLGPVRITDTVLERCDLSGAVLGFAALSRVEFVDCRLSGVVLAGARLADVRLVSCRLDGASFRMTTGQHVSFEDCGGEGADFYGATLARTRFFDCNLTGADFDRAHLDGARFHGSAMEAVTGAGSLRGVVIDSGQLVPMAVLALAAMGIRIDDDRGPGGSRR